MKFLHTDHLSHSHDELTQTSLSFLTEYLCCCEEFCLLLKISLQGKRTYDLQLQCYRHTGKYINCLYLFFELFIRPVSCKQIGAANQKE